MVEPMNHSGLRSALRNLGEEVARHQDAHRRKRFTPEATEDFERARQERIAPKASRAMSGRRSAAAAGLLAAAIAVVWGLRARPLSFAIGGQEGRTGELFASNDAQTFRFSDGSSLERAPGSVVHVVQTRTAGAEIVVERGRVSASVVHRADSRWSVDVGPFQIRVTGTKFDTAWDPTEQLFTLDLLQGSVQVTGCSMTTQGVRAGTRMRASCKDGQSTVQIEAGEPAAASPPASDPVTDGGAPVRASEPTASVGGARERREPAGFRRDPAPPVAPRRAGGPCSERTPIAALELAEVERHSGATATAETELLSLRGCFPRATEASTAAFLLGRIAFDRGEFATSSAWFDAASSESPGGPLAREAAGRQIEARERAGDHAAARDAAASYIKRFPSGPYAGLAQLLLER